MAFDLETPLLKLRDLAKKTQTGEAITARVTIGVPFAVASTELVLALTLGGQVINDKTTGLLQRTATYFAEWAYLTSGDVERAERALATWLDAFVDGLYTDPKLGNTVLNAVPDFSLLNQPTYRPTPRNEFRIFPLLVICTQQRTRP